MVFLQSLSWASVKPLPINPRNLSFRKFFARSDSPANYHSAAAVETVSDEVAGRLNNFSGIKIAETVELASGKLRIDSWITSRIAGISRARVQSSIRSGLVSVNGQLVNKVSHVVKDGDTVNCTVAELQPLRAEPEDIPLDIVFEDGHVLVVNKPAHMVVHPAPGNATGTLVNGILRHCRISTACLSPELLPDFDDDSADEVSAFSMHHENSGGFTSGLSEASVRPGIVHRLDKGTSGLLVVAKDEHSHLHLAEQFKEHTIKRVYVSLTCGVPSAVSGRIDVSIGRDPNNRIRMVALPGSGAHGKTRHAVSSGNFRSILYNKASFHSNSMISIPDLSYPSSPSVSEKNKGSGLKTEETLKTKMPGFDISLSHNNNTEIYGAGAHSSILSAIEHVLGRRSTASLNQVRQAHAHILIAGLLDIPLYSTKLISIYVNHQRVLDARNLLSSLLKPDLHSYATIINFYSKHNDFKSILSLFSSMLSKGIFPNAYLLPVIIKACARLLAVNIGKQIHGFSVTCGLSRDPFVESSMIHFYVKCDEIIYAHKLFYGMAERDVVSWSALAGGYARKGDVANVRKVFDEVQSFGFGPNIVSWNGVIAGFNQSGCTLDAVLMFQSMHLQGFRCDNISLSSVLPAIGDLGYLKMGSQVHAYVIKMGFASDMCTVSSLIDMYGKCQCGVEMSQVFEESGKMDTVVCNATIAGLSRLGLIDKALSIFRKVQRQCVELDVVSWTSIIACCSQHGKDIEALELFREMQLSGVKPNSVTIPCLLPACGNIAALEHGKATHCFSLKRGISYDVYVGSALIDMYANCGKVQVARLCFDRMPVRNLVCWNAMLGAYAMHGEGNEAVKLFLMMQRNGQKADHVSFTSLLSACSQSGLTEEGRHYFESMTRDYGIEAGMEHYACIVSLLGRAGKLEEAYSMVMRMPFEPDSCVWGALLSSCRLHHNMSLGEIAAGKLFQLEPNNPGNYILMSNIYASKGKWKEVDRIRDSMKEKGMRKYPGCSWIELKNKVHMLLAGDTSLPQMNEIMKKLRELSTEMKRAGHFPNTDFVLQDVEEQEKEHILCGHSEKLAVVLGLLNTSEGTSLRVTKNLRICGDCHAFIKFISEFERREIYVRDTNRYHHFKDGNCSCGDYW